MNYILKQYDNLNTHNLQETVFWIFVCSFYCLFKRVPLKMYLWHTCVLWVFKYDNDLLYFSMKNTNDGLEVLINTVNQNLQYLLPLDLELSNEGLKKWLQKRTIPRNRAYVSNFLSRLGLNEKDTKGIIDICQGLSLNDSYWVVQEDCKDLFKNAKFMKNVAIRLLNLT